VLDDLVYKHDGYRLGGSFGQVEAGGLQAIEEQTSASGIDVVRGDALEDLGNGKLDAGAIHEVGGVREKEGATARLAGGGVGDGTARGVVVVAELLFAEAGACASATVGEDVAALEAGVFVAVGWLVTRVEGLRHWLPFE
jgi:hypothetical protein